MHPLEHLAQLPAVDGVAMAALALEHIPVSASIVSAIRDDDGRVTDFCIQYSNLAASAASTDRTEAYGMALFDIIPAFREVGLFERYVEVLETGVPYTEENVRLTGTYGDLAYDLRVDVVATPLGPDHVLSVSHDRTAEHEVNVRLTNVQETLSRRQAVEQQIHEVNVGLVDDLVQVRRAIDAGDVDAARQHAMNGAARAAGVVTGLRNVIRTGP